MRGGAMVPFGGKTAAFAGSAMLHAAAFAFVAFGHAAQGGAIASTSIDAELVDVETVPAPEEAPDPLPAARGSGAGAPAFPTHTHAYPVPFDHDAHPHDPNLVHIAAAALAPPALDNPYASEPVAAAPSAAPAPPPRFHLVVGAATAGGAPGTGAGTGTGTGTARGPDADAIVPASRVSVPARPISTVLPAYPPAARAQGIEGSVLVEIVVDTSGAVLSARVARAGGHGFDEAALAAIRGFRFSPAELEGHPVRVRMLWPVAFQLR